MKVPENASSLLCLRCLLPTKRCSLKYLQPSLKRHLLSQSKLSSSAAKLREGNHSPHNRKMAITLTLSKKTLLLCFSQLLLQKEDSSPLFFLASSSQLSPSLRSLSVFFLVNPPLALSHSSKISLTASSESSCQQPRYLPPLCQTTCPASRNTLLIYSSSRTFLHMSHFYWFLKCSADSLASIPELTRGHLRW